ncbi:MAG TPA: peptidoglycan-binding domain-containing protein [Candidatus Dormibacteraeota bacterium]|nr:peptidoglycan-binding domain-containing protein [Candidatus Dormibacteraeota bacterium]
MVSGWTGTRKARLGAVCALLLGCVFASAQDSSSAATESTSAKKPGSTSASTSSTSGAKSRSKSHKASSGKRSRRKSARLRGQQKIDSERAQAIQEALIREHYLKGEPTGTWNQASEDAMRKYQADHGWQSKTVPDSRALISLGLGPSKDHLLNPESAMTTLPDRPKSGAPAPASHDPAPTSDPLPPSSSSPATSSPVEKDRTIPQ